VSDGGRFGLQTHIASRHRSSLVQSPVQKVTTMASQTLPASAFKNPAVALSGVVDYEMYRKSKRCCERQRSTANVEPATVTGVVSSAG
jgi:hypothetical protein